MSATDKIKFIELNYHCHQELSQPKDVIAKHLPSNLFASYLKDFADITLVKHLNFEGELEKDGIGYKFFRRNNRFTQIPLRTHRFIKEQQPDMMLVQGFIFPIQLMFLRRAIGKKPIIVLQHQGEQPAGKKLHFQRIADQYVDGYVFSSIGNADEWLKAKVIKTKNKCSEMPSSSTDFSKLNKKECRNKLGMPAGINFLWVGRLNKNKDPMTVLKAFEKKPSGLLWMLYSEQDMIDEIKTFIENSRTLKEKIKLVGNRPHAELETWYNAADYFISASHREGGSYSLTEAMACGCIPIVTKIPSSMDAIENGNAGYYFEPGNSERLATILNELDYSNQQEMSERVVDRFNKHLTAKSIAERLKNIYKSLRSEE